MTKLEALVGLNFVGDIGSVRLGRLLEYFGSAEKILSAPEDKLIRIQGIGQELAQRITSLKKQDLAKELSLAEKYGLRIITIDSPDYPRNLKNIPGAPIVLYVKGELREEDKLSIAVVGSRRASLYGLRCAEKFAAQLSGYGFTIVSGMARGVDTYAHRGALRRMGRTIAVIGSGFCEVYPPENEKLCAEIAENGAVVSEFPLHTLPLRQNFPRRNRVISGLSLGVLVVEAARNSGALITADFALEQGREVFALPGKVDSGNSFGPNELIKQGAKTVTSAEDIIEEFSLNISEQVEAERPKKIIPRSMPLSAEEKLLCEMILVEPMHLDEIAQKSGLNISAISSALLKLELKKIIRQLPGKQFVRETNEKKFSYC